jgi:hypothetical protein
MRTNKIRWWRWQGEVARKGDKERWRGEMARGDGEGR